MMVTVFVSDEEKIEKKGKKERKKGEQVIPARSSFSHRQAAPRGVDEDEVEDEMEVSPGTEVEALAAFLSLLINNRASSRISQRSWFYKGTDT